MIIRKVFKDCTLQSYVNSFTKHSQRLITKGLAVLRGVKNMEFFLLTFQGWRYDLYEWKVLAGCVCPTESSSHSRYHHSHSSQGPGALIPSIWGTLLSGKIRSLPLDKLTRQKFVLNSSTCALSPLDFEINPRKRLIHFNPVFLYFYVNRHTVIFSVQYINKTGGNVQTTGDCDN